MLHTTLSKQGIWYVADNGNPKGRAAKPMKIVVLLFPWKCRATSGFFTLEFREKFLPRCFQLEIKGNKTVSGDGEKTAEAPITLLHNPSRVLQ